MGSCKKYVNYFLYVCNSFNYKNGDSIDNTYIQEQHARMNNALLKFEPGTLNAMWSILQGLYAMDKVKIEVDKIIPNTNITLKDINSANECEYYLAFTQKNASIIAKKITPRPQMYIQVSFVKSELYKAYSLHIQQHYGDSGINFISSGLFLGGK